ncbi:hypothetical protein [Streptomyces misionensis]|uniref:hypothetical protein n=1 Tax=Streptomyces misionensis TaxID=67331 RepID=UPI0016460131|nr:hypothetical protein [Streptomyces misionensis]
MGKRNVRPLAVAIASAAAVAGLLAVTGPASAATEAPGARHVAAVSAAARTGDDHTDIRRQWVLDQLRWAGEHGYAHLAPESHGPSDR